MILMNDFHKEYKYYKKYIDKGISEVLEGGWYILGPHVEKFEKNFAKYVGTKFCVGVGNGMEAIQIALMALGINKGDEVLTVSNTAVATVLAITAVGAKPVFVDVGKDYNMDPKDAEKHITKRTKAILVVHIFGQVANIEQLIKLAKKHKLLLIEDACQAHGAKVNGKRSGSFGTIGCFSFYPTKNLGAYGDAGAITTNSAELYKKCLMLRNYGQSSRYVHDSYGINSRLDEIQAAILDIKLRHLNKMIMLRRAVAKRYIRNLKSVSQIILPIEKKGFFHSYHLFVVRAQRRNDLQVFLAKNSVQSLIHYPIPVHKQRTYSGYNSKQLVNTEAFAEEILSLPINPFVTNREVDKVSSLIKKFYEKYN